MTGVKRKGGRPACVGRPGRCRRSARRPGRVWFLRASARIRWNLFRGWPVLRNNENYTEPCHWGCFHVPIWHVPLVRDGGLAPPILPSKQDAIPPGAVRCTSTREGGRVGIEGLAEAPHRLRIVRNPAGPIDLGAIRVSGRDASAEILCRPNAGRHRMERRYLQRHEAVIRMVRFP